MASDASAHLRGFQTPPHAWTPPRVHICVGTHDRIAQAGPQRPQRAIRLVAVGVQTPNLEAVDRALTVEQPKPCLGLDWRATFPPGSWCAWHYLPFPAIGVDI